MSNVFKISNYQFLLILLAAIVFGLLAGAVVSFINPLIAFAAVGGVVGAVVLLRDVQWGLWGVMAVSMLLPFGALPLNVGFSPTFLDLVTLMLVGVWFSQLATGSRRGWRNTPLDLPIIIFLTLAFFSFILGLGFSSLTLNTLRHFAEIILAIALYLVIINVLQDERDYTRAAKILIWLGVAASFIGIALYVIPDDVANRLLNFLRVFKYPTGNVLRYIEDNPALPKRAIATAVDPNVLGGMLILVMALALPQWLSPQRLFARKWLVLMLATMGVCLLLTFSRGSLLGVSFSLAFIVFAWLSRRLPTAIAASITIVGAAILALLGLGLLFVIPLTETYAQHLVEGLMGQDRATLMRFGEYKDALELISRYPWFGVGFSGVPDIDLYRGVSSVYLLMATEMGLVGVSAFALIMLIFFWQSWRAFRRSAEFDGLLVGCMAAVFGALVGGIFDHYFFNLDFIHSVTLFWLCVALGMRRAVERTTRDNDAAPALA